MSELPALPCPEQDDDEELDRQGASTELQALLGVPPGVEGVRLPD